MNKFFLYFNPLNGNIKAVSPIIHNEYSEPFIEIEHDLGLDFLTGRKQLAKSCVSKKGDDWIVVNSMLDFVTDSKHDFIEVKDQKHDITFNGIVCIMYPASNIMEFSIPNRYKGSKLICIDEKELIFTLTKHNDIDAILQVFTVQIDELLREGAVRIPLDDFKDSKSFSLFTKGVFNSYSFQVKNSVWKNKSIGTRKVNNLVKWKVVKKITKKEIGIVATHNIKKRQLAISVANNSALMVDMAQRAVVFFTMADDPTIILNQFSINVEHLNDSVITIDIPFGVDDDFGLAGPAMAEQMFILRKAK